MDNKLIIKVSLAAAMIGIIGLYIFTTVSQNAIAIADASNFMGQRITVKGTVGSYYVNKDGHAFFEVADKTGSIKAVAFRNSNIEAVYNMKDGQEILLTGKVQEYKNEPEIIASKIGS